MRGAYGVVSSMFHEAVMQEVVCASPCVLRGRELPAIRDKDPEWRDTALFSAEEVALLVLDERVPLDRRVFYGLMFLGCMRFGEAAFLRWKHYRPDLEPLGCLHIVGTYNSKLKHDARRTWISLVLAAGATETHAKWIAHGPPPTVLGSYTTMPCATLCKVVEALESIGRKAVATPGI